MMRSEVLTARERAFIIDKICGSSYYADEFGELSKKKEKELIFSIFKKLELTYYLPIGSKYFQVNKLNFTENEAREALSDLEELKNMFENALK